MTGVFTGLMDVDSNHFCWAGGCGQQLMLGWLLRTADTFIRLELRSIWLVITANDDDEETAVGCYGQYVAGSIILLIYCGQPTILGENNQSDVKDR